MKVKYLKFNLYQFSVCGVRKALFSKPLMALLLMTSVLAGAVDAGARSLTVDQKLQDFRSFVSTVSANYGPLEYKTQKGIVDVNKLNQKFEAEIQQTTTNRDFYYAMVRYVAAYRDGHFGISVPTTHAASIPIVTDLVDGKILITRIDRKKLTEAQFGFAVGDEVVTIDGFSAQDYIKAAAQFIGSGNPQTSLKQAAWTVFSRRGSRLPVSASKTIKVEIRRGTSSIVEPIELTWNFTGKALDEADLGPIVNPPLAGQFSFAQPRGYDILNKSLYQDFVHPSADRDFACAGSSRIAVPVGATMISSDPFVAYSYQTPKGAVGYLRIPHYYPTNAAGEVTEESMRIYLAQYEFAVREFEKTTVGLIIDQDHNCGGSVSLVHSMIAFFMQKPFVPSQFELLANKESFLSFQGWVNETPENTIDREVISKVLKLVEDTWKLGVSFLTPKTSIDGVEFIQPNRVAYTKPVVILIDEIAGSGGDMFPAMMKGLGRAKLFGQTTSGLGGHVQEFPAGLPNSQMKFRITKSLFYRPDGVAIENNGAVPDTNYIIKRDDVLFGFKEYQKTYTDYIMTML
jgi:Peptidase family S41/PDZ domain